MKLKQTRIDNKCKKYRPEQEYTHTQEFLDNLPYIMMIILGSLILFFSIQLPYWNLLAGILFIIYGVLGTVWFIIFICPYCHFYGTRSCPCGYGQIATKIKPKAKIEQFNEKFKKHIPVIFPLWILPLLVGAISIIYTFSSLILILIILFIIDAFIVLPLISRKYGCAHCPQKDNCPWMVSGK